MISWMEGWKSHILSVQCRSRVEILRCYSFVVIHWIFLYGLCVVVLADEDKKTITAGSLVTATVTLRRGSFQV